MTDNSEQDLDPEQGDKDPHVPADLIVLSEVLEWDKAVKGAGQ